MLNKLPTEVLECICEFLDGQDIVELELASKKLCEICRNHRLWYKIIEKFVLSNKFSVEYDLHSMENMKLQELKFLYLKVIKRWGWLIGLWKRELKKFGGLMNVKLESGPLRIVGYDIQAIDFLVHPVAVFVIPLEESCDVNKVICSLYPKVEHSCNVTSTGDNDIVLTCQDIDPSDGHDLYQMTWDFEKSLGINCSAIPRALIAEQSLNGGMKYSRICKHLQSAKECFLSSGYFVGDYGPHCFEIVTLQSSAENIFFTKVSGDQNVRSGSISINVDTSYPIDYISFLGLISEHGHEFNFQNALSDLHIIDFDQQKLGTVNTVPGKVIQSLEIFDQTFGLTEENTFLAAFKGQITLGNTPTSEIPTYYFRDIVAVIVDYDTVALHIYYDEDYVGLGYEMLLKRIPCL